MFEFLSRFPAPFNSPLFFTTAIGAALVYAAFRISTPGGSTKSITDGVSKLPRRNTPMTELPQLQVEKPSRKAGDRRASVAGESVTEDELATPTKIVHEKSKEARERIAEITKKCLLIRNLDRKQKEDIFDAMLEKNVSTGEEIIKQGDEGDFFYVVDSGHFEILVNGNKVAEATRGGSFGELALLYNQPRAATVRATTESTVWAVDRSTFRRLVLGSNARKRRQYQTFLKEVSILSSLTPEEIVKVVDALEPVSFQKGEHIIQEGQFGDTFYIIEDGSVTVTIQDKVVGNKSKGEYFGEIALLTDGFRVATVTADADVDCLVLDKNAFVRLLGPCVDILKRNMENYNKFQEHVKAQ